LPPTRGFDEIACRRLRVSSDDEMVDLWMSFPLIVPSLMSDDVIRCAASAEPRDEHPSATPATGC